MPKKVKCQSCSKGRCSNHLFQMLPLKNSPCYFRKKTKLRLCPKLNPSTQSFSNGLPQLNSDHKHYTPCFIMEDQKNYYQDNDQKLLGNHKQKLQSQGTCTIWEPKHGRKRNFCSVCKIQYEDYKQHTDSQTHKVHLRCNKFSKYIKEVQGKMKVSQLQEFQSIEKFIDPISKMVDETIDIEKQKVGKD